MRRKEYYSYILQRYFMKEHTPHQRDLNAFHLTASTDVVSVFHAYLYHGNCFRVKTNVFTISIWNSALSTKFSIFLCFFSGFVGFIVLLFHVEILAERNMKYPTIHNEGLWLRNKRYECSNNKNAFWNFLFFFTIRKATEKNAHIIIYCLKCKRNCVSLQWYQHFFYPHFFPK